MTVGDGLTLIYTKLREVCHDPVKNMKDVPEASEIAMDIRSTLLSEHPKVLNMKINRSWKED